MQKLLSNGCSDALPTTYLIGKDGKLLAMDLSEKQLEKALKDLL